MESVKDLAEIAGESGVKADFSFYFFPPEPGSRTSLTLFSRAAKVKGFCKNAVPGSKTPWWTMALSGYPDMNSTFVSGRTLASRSANSRPLICGMITSVTIRWIGP